jgi:hypothetical protein
MVFSYFPNHQVKPLRYLWGLPVLLRHIKAPHGATHRLSLVVLYLDCPGSIPTITNKSMHVDVDLRPSHEFMMPSTHLTMLIMV